MKNSMRVQKNQLKGAAIFKKMLEDKYAIREHLKKGGKIADLKNKFNFAKPIPVEQSNESI